MANVLKFMLGVCYSYLMWKSQNTFCDFAPTWMGWEIVGLVMSFDKWIWRRCFVSNFVEQRELQHYKNNFGNLLGAISEHSSETKVLT